MGGYFYTLSTTVFKTYSPGIISFVKTVIHLPISSFMYATFLCQKPLPQGQMLCQNPHYCLHPLLLGKP